MATDGRWLPPTAAACHRLPPIAADCRRLPPTAADCRRATRGAQLHVIDLTTAEARAAKVVQHRWGRGRKGRERSEVSQIEVGRARALAHAALEDFGGFMLPARKLIGLYAASGR